MGSCFKSQKKPPATTIQIKNPVQENPYKLASPPKIQAPENVAESSFPQINKNPRNNKILIATKEIRNNDKSELSSETDPRTLPFNKQKKKDIPNVE